MLLGKVPDLDSEEQGQESRGPEDLAHNQVRVIPEPVEKLGTQEDQLGFGVEHPLLVRDQSLPGVRIRLQDLGEVFDGLTPDRPELPLLGAVAGSDHLDEELAPGQGHWTG